MQFIAINMTAIVAQWEQNGLVVKTTPYGTEGPRFDPRQYPFIA